VPRLLLCQKACLRVQLLILLWCAAQGVLVCDADGSTRNTGTANVLVEMVACVSPLLQLVCFTNVLLLSRGGCRAQQAGSYIVLCVLTARPRCQHHLLCVCVLPASRRLDAQAKCRVCRQCLFLNTPAGNWGCVGHHVRLTSSDGHAAYACTAERGVMRDMFPQHDVLPDRQASDQ
jgi:hypothetical protein